MIKKILLLSFISLIISPILAQKTIDYEEFVNEAGEFSNIYRGEAPMIYNFRHIGTFYAYSETFEVGNVCFNGKVYYDLKLNLNSHLDELNLEVGDAGRKVVLNTDFVDWFSYGGRKFVNHKDFNNNTGSIPQPGYFQLLYNGSSKLYKKIKKIYSERINENASADSKSKLEKHFLVNESFYLLRDRKFVIVKKKRDFLLLYKSRKKEIRQFIRENNLDLREDKEHSFAQIVKFLESGISNSNE